MIKKLIWIVQRYLQKRKLRGVLGGLPGDIQPVVMEKLVALLDSPDRAEKVRKTREVFQDISEKIRADYDQNISALKGEYAERRRKAAERVMTPNFPLLEVKINHDTLNEKVKARLTLESLEDEILNVQKPNKILMTAAFLGIMFSIAITYITFRNRFGTDWANGEETLTLAGNVFLTIAFNALEASTLYALLHFMPKRYRYGVSRLIGIVSVIMIFVGIVIIIVTRTELGAYALSALQDMGKVE